jgi:hypothetical protein
VNWALKNVILPRKAPFFGFIDHDVFPARPTSIVSHLRTQDFYGVLQERNDRWYLWPGFCFFRQECCEKAKLNFLPVDGLDTGGGNFLRLYSRYDKDKLSFPSQVYERLLPGESLQDAMIEHIGGEWIHALSASNWMNSPFAKTKWKMLQAKLQ